jgi:hypothetical protein
VVLVDGNQVRMDVRACGLTVFDRSVLHGAVRMCMCFGRITYRNPIESTHPPRINRRCSIAPGRGWSMVWSSSPACCTTGTT